MAYIAIAIGTSAALAVGLAFLLCYLTKDLDEDDFFPTDESNA